MNTKMSMLISCCAACLAVSGLARAAEDYTTKTPDALDATIIYADPDSREEKEITGKLKFDKMPLLLDGKPFGMSLRDLVSFRYRDEGLTCWIRRDDKAAGPNPVFLVCGMPAIMRVEFAFDRVGIAVQAKTGTPAWDWSAGAPADADEDLDDEELDAILDGKKPEPPPPLILEIEKKIEGFKFIPARQIKEIRIKTLQNWRYYA